MIRKSAPSLILGALTLLLFAGVVSGRQTLIATDFLQSSPVWRAGPYPVANPWLSDTVEYYYPSEKIYSEQVRRGRLPLVNPYVFNGAPVPHGVHIWNSIWPVKLVFLLLFDPIRSYDLFAVFHWWLAGIAMYYLLGALGRGHNAAFMAAFVYILSGRAMLWLHGHYLMATMAYVPLVFLAAKRGSLLGVIPVAGLFFTNPQIGAAACAAVILWERPSWKFVVPGFLMAAVALVPLAAAVSGGLRDPRGEAGWFYRDGFRSWLWLAGLVAPGWVKGSMPPNEYNVYIGLGPLAGALLAARRERFFAGMAIVALAVATLYPLPVWISSVSFSLPTRYLFFFTFGACICFARALELRPMKEWMLLAVIVLVIVDLAPRFQAWNPRFEPDILREHPPAVAAMKGRVGVYLPETGRPFFPPLSIFGVESVQGYDVMVPKAQAEAIRGAGEVAGQRLIRLTNPESPVLDELGMRFLVADRTYESKRFRLVYEGTVRVFENPYARELPPRPLSKTPLWIGLAATLVGCGWTVAAALLDRRLGATL
ncbi:MAG: hypothetical protein HY293_21660 [Planctomycetes bacterium]|nr:hypothetical protein [Planctomycetota bacterium]